MCKVQLLVAESVEFEGVYALDPHFAEGTANATRTWIEARVFESREEAIEWCEASQIPFRATELTFEFDYLH